MKIKALAVRMGCAIALANWASPSLPAQQSTASTDADPGQQGAFDGDHQDTGAAAIDGKETADSGKETAEVAESTTENLPEAHSAPCHSIQQGYVLPATIRMRVFAGIIRAGPPTLGGQSPNAELSSS